MKTSLCSIGMACVLLWSGMLAAAEPPSAVGAVMKLLKSGRVPQARLGAVLDIVCARGNEHDLAFAFEQAAAPGTLSLALRRDVLRKLADAAVQRKVIPAGDLSAVGRMIDPQSEPDDDLRRTAVQLAGVWKVESSAGALQKLARDETSAPEERAAALAALAGLGRDAAEPVIAAFLEPSQPFGVRVAGVATLARLDLAAAAKHAAAALQTADAEADLAPIIDAFLERRGGPAELAGAVAAAPPSEDVAKVALRRMYANGSSDPQLSSVLSRIAGFNEDPPLPTPEEVLKLVAEVEAAGDAARGEAVFRRDDLSCMKCHAVSKGGGQIGPDLSPVGSTSPIEFLVNSILNPDLAVKEAYTSRRVLTDDGEVFHGVVANRTDDVLVLKEASGRTVTVPLADIDDEVDGKSLMPKGLVKFMTHAELVDLVKFLSRLGKPGDYAIRTMQRMQRWRLLMQAGPDLVSGVPNDEVFADRVLTSLRWLPVYGRVDGTLPLAELTAATKQPVVYAMGEINVTAAGVVGVRLDSADGVQMWIDGDGYGSVDSMTAELPAGVHTIVLRVDTTARAADGVKLELFRAPDSQAEATVVDGA